MSNQTFKEFLLEKYKKDSKKKKKKKKKNKDSSDKMDVDTKANGEHDKLVDFLNQASETNS